MAVTRNTPRIGASGTYAVASPFSLDSDTAYTCKAIRSFAELANSGIDVESQIYDTNGINSSTYSEHRLNDVHIITLYSASGKFVDIPDAYITGMPTGDSIDYGSVVIAAHLGMLPLYLDHSDVMTEIEDIINQRVGVTVDMKVMSGPIRNGPITYAQHSVLETARANSISTESSLASKNRELIIKIESITQKLNDAEARLKDLGDI